MVPGSKSMASPRRDVEDAAIGEHHAQRAPPSGAWRRSGSCASRWRWWRWCRRWTADGLGGVGRIELAACAGPRRADRAAERRRPRWRSPGWTSRRLSFSSESTHPPKGTRAAGDAGAGARDGDAASGRGRFAQARPRRRLHPSGIRTRSAWPRRPEASSR